MAACARGSFVGAVIQKAVNIHALREALIEGYNAGKQLSPSSFLELHCETDVEHTNTITVFTRAAERLQELFSK